MLIPGTIDLMMFFSSDEINHVRDGGCRVSEFPPSPPQAGPAQRDSITRDSGSFVTTLLTRAQLFKYSFTSQNNTEVFLFYRKIGNTAAWGAGLARLEMEFSTIAAANADANATPLRPPPPSPAADAVCILCVSAPRRQIALQMTLVAELGVS